jgi:alkylation response protein AidB-like acyl-CoA dehydrogenase
MDFALTEEQLAFLDTAKDFARERLLPNASRWDEERHFPADPSTAAFGLARRHCTCTADMGL